MKRIVLLCLLLWLFGEDARAQILGRIADRAVRKVEQRLEEKIVETIAEGIARRVYKPVEDAVEEMLREAYRDSLAQGEEVDWEKVGESYALFLQGLNEAVDVPDSYGFDISMEVETRDYDGSKNRSWMHFAKEKPYLGIENLDENKSVQLLVIDMEKDIIILYTTDAGGNKSAQAIPSMMKTMHLFASSQPEANLEEENDNFSFRQEGRGKRIAGYQTTRFVGATNEEEMEWFVAASFPVSYEKTFEPYLAQFAPQTYTGHSKDIEGMVLESTSTSKEDTSLTSSWKVLQVREQNMQIVNEQFGL